MPLTLLCGRPIISTGDRKAWTQAIALLVGLKVRNGYGDEDLTASVGKALQRSSTQRVCESCKLKRRTFGLLSEGKARWCSGCAKAHAGAEDLIHKKCESCGLKSANFGLPSDGAKRRWCSGCAPKGCRGPGYVYGPPPKKTQKAANPHCHLGP